MKIEINDNLKNPLLGIAKTTKLSADMVVEHAVIFTMVISQLPEEKREIIKLLLEDSGLPDPFSDVNDSPSVE